MGNDREMTVVERQVAAMLRKQREEQDEQAALSRRAEELRSRGEQALNDNGDLDEDSDSEHDDLERRGATGRARREFRDLFAGEGRAAARCFLCARRETCPGPRRRRRNVVAVSSRCHRDAVAM